MCLFERNLGASSRGVSTHRPIQGCPHHGGANTGAQRAQADMHVLTEQYKRYIGQG